MPRRDFRPKDKSQRQTAAAARPSGAGKAACRSSESRAPAANGHGASRSTPSSGRPNGARKSDISTSIRPSGSGRKIVFNDAGEEALPLGASSRSHVTQEQGRPRNGSGRTADNDVRDSDDDSILDDDAMMAEIEALGGDRSDLDLIKNVGGSTSRAAPAPADQSLHKDLQAFIKQLDLPSVAPADSDESNDEEDEGSADEKVMTRPEDTAKVAVTDKGPARQRREDTKSVKSEVDDNNMRTHPSLSAAEVVIPPGKSYFHPADPSQLAAAQHRAGRGGLAAPVTPLWSQVVLPKLTPAPPPSEKVRRKAKAANIVGQHAALSDEHIAALDDRATQLLARENAVYAQMFEAEATGNANAKYTLAAAGSNISSSDARFIRTLLSTSGEGGTLSDRISALTLLLQSSPLHNLKALESLMAMVRKKNREESGRASRALSDWFASATGLPSECKLRYLRDQPGLADVAYALSDDSPSKEQVAAAELHLLVFAFEQRLKTTFYEFLLLLEARSHDMLSFARTSAVIQISNLLSAKAEQEQNLLRLLVNKLGDGERSVAAKASNALLELLNQHPAMKSIVVREVADLILRPVAAVPNGGKSGSGSASTRQSDGPRYNTHARYYGVLTLNQTMITSQDRESGLANALVNLYFDLFEGILEDMDSGRRTDKTMGGREQELGAGGEAEDTNDEEDEADDSSRKPKQKGRWRDQAGGRRRKGKGQPLSSHGGKEVNAVVKDAEAKIVAALLTGVRRAMPFATLETTVFERHIDTLFRITHSGTFNISIQALQLIFQVCTSASGKTRSKTSKSARDGGESAFTTSAALTNRYYRTLYASLIDPRLEETSKQAMYLNLLFRSMKVDIGMSMQGGEEETERVRSFTRRLVQVLGHHQPPFVCGALFLLGELSKLSEALRVMITTSLSPSLPPEAETDDLADSSDSKVANGSYDGTKRDPRFAHAGSSSLWELNPLLSHYHPSVALHARQLLEGTTITANADLNTSSLSHFLDRFVYRNPKAKAPSAKGASIMQPGAGGGTGFLSAGVGVDDVNVVNLKGRGLTKDEDVMDPGFWKKSREEVPVDQIFFHQYFQQKQTRKHDITKNQHQDDGEEEDVASGTGSASDEDEGADSATDSDEVDEDEAMDAIMKALPEAGHVDDSDIGDDLDGADEDGSSLDDGLKAEDFSEDEELDAMLGRGSKSLNGKGDSGSDDDGEDDEVDSGDDTDSSDEQADSDDVQGGNAAMEEDDDDDSLDIELLEDDDDLISIDGGSDSDQDGSMPNAPGSASLPHDKRKRALDDGDEAEGRPLTNREKRQQRKKRKALPTFASADDYAHLLASDDEGN